MEALKRVAWRVGQPLLPGHLFAQEDSLIAYSHASFKQLGLPFYGISALKWDNTLLMQGIVSIAELTVIFANGKLVNVPGNGIIQTFDLNQSEKSRVTLYLNLLSSKNEEEDYMDSGLEHEKIIYAVHELELSDDPNAPLLLAAMKLGEFEKDLENHWKLCPEYIPPLLSVRGTPFLSQALIELKTKVEQFQNSIEMISVEGEDFEGHTLETNLCLLEAAKMRRLLLNIHHHIATHPFILYEALSRYLDTVALLHQSKNTSKVIPYQHEKLGPLFQEMISSIRLDETSGLKTSHLPFEKKERCYVSEKLPQDLEDAKEVYLIVQKVEQTGNPNVEGLKLSASSRLMNTIIFGVQGIPIIRLERAPFSHNFSKRANIYSIEKGIEWNHAFKEGRLAFDYKDNHADVQASLYWK